MELLRRFYSKSLIKDNELWIQRIEETGTGTTVLEEYKFTRVGKLTLGLTGDKIFFSFNPEHISLSESFLMNHILKESLPVSNGIYSTSVNNLLFFKFFSDLRYCNGKAVQIIDFLPKLKILASWKYSTLNLGILVDEKHDFETVVGENLIFKINTSVLKIYVAKEISETFSRWFSKAQKIQLNWGEAAELFSRIKSDDFFRNNCMIIHEKQKPSFLLKAPTVFLEEHGFLTDSGKAALHLKLFFKYAKHQPKALFLRDFDFEKNVKSCLTLLGGNVSENWVSFFNSRALDIKFEPSRFKNEFFKKSGVNLGLRLKKSSVKLKELPVMVHIKVDERKLATVEISFGLKKGDFEVMVSALSDEASMHESWIFCSEQFLRLPFGKLSNLRLLLEYLNAEPQFSLSSFCAKNLPYPQAISFHSFIKHFKLVKVHAVGFRHSQPRGKYEFFKSLEGQTFLRDYQIEGVKWLLNLYQQGLGGILADEMGLGKTVQALSFLDIIKKSKKLLFDLIICPTSVLYTWVNEINKFFPHLKYLVFYGPKRREQFLDLVDYCKEPALIITTYPIVRLDGDFLANYHFEVIVIDEAQMIKNVDSLTAKSVKGLSANFRLALSGTPVENRPLELWSIFDFILKGTLGSKAFFLNYIEKELSNETLDKLQKSLSPFILRRVKEQALPSLPAKVETEEIVEMIPTQREMYDRYLTSWRQAFQKGPLNYLNVLAVLTKLRQICNHPLSLEDGDESSGVESGKFNRLKELILELVANSRKVVVFCQFIKMIELIKDFCEENSILNFVFTGQTRNRQKVLEQFNSADPPCVLIMSLKAGGLGLNLSSASTVILYDPWWNPHVERQAIDRLHRIGQKNTVFVYRLITNDSIESRMAELKKTKIELFDALLRGQPSRLNLRLVLDFLLK